MEMKSVLNTCRREIVTTSSDEEWLDGAGNLVDEEHIVELLDS